MPEYYDADGNLVEGVMPPEEAEKLKQEHAKAQEELETTKSKLAGLENKDFNFKKLRDMTEEEMKKLSATELELKKKQEQLEEQQNAFWQSQVNEIKDDILEGLSDGDEELKKKIKFNFERIKDADKLTTRKEIKQAMNEAYNMLGLSSKTNPLSQAMGISGSSSKQSKGKLSSDAKALGAKLGLTEADLKDK